MVDNPTKKTSAPFIIDLFRFRDKGFPFANLKHFQLLLQFLFKKRTDKKLIKAVLTTPRIFSNFP